MGYMVGYSHLLKAAIDARNHATAAVSQNHGPNGKESSVTSGS